jgi:sporulation protein YlmC with PRC-barrel domain
MNTSDDLPVKRHRGELIDARLHLLDRQLLDHDGDPIGIVDDLELDGVEFDEDIANDAEAPRVTALLSGQILATRIFGGAPPRSRLQEIPWKLVTSVGVVVRLKPTDMTFDVSWVERWLRDHIVKHIPGGQHAAE